MGHTGVAKHWKSFVICFSEEEILIFCSPRPYPLILLQDEGVGLIDSSEQCCHGRVGVERNGNLLHDFWQFLDEILGVTLVQELVVAAPGVSGIWRCGLSIPETQAVLKVRMLLTSVGFASRVKNSLSGQMNIIMVDHD